eukprot:jgi/Mesvir1/22435/Mv17908-RA.1
MANPVPARLMEKQSPPNVARQVFGTQLANNALFSDDIEERISSLDAIHDMIRNAIVTPDGTVVLEGDQGNNEQFDPADVMVCGMALGVQAMQHETEEVLWAGWQLFSITVEEMMHRIEDPRPGLAAVKPVVPAIVAALGRGTNAGSEERLVEACVVLAEHPKVGIRIVVPSVLSGLVGRQGQVAAGLLQVLRRFCMVFPISATTAMPVESMFPPVVTALKSSSPAVREAAVLVTGEVYRQLKKKISPYLKGLDKNTVETLDKEFRRVEVDMKIGNRPPLRRVSVVLGTAQGPKASSSAPDAADGPIPASSRSTVNDAGGSPQGHEAAPTEDLRASYEELSLQRSDAALEDTPAAAAVAGPTGEPTSPTSPASDTEEDDSHLPGISQEMLLAGGNYPTIGRLPPADAFLEKLTHLRLNGKGIQKISNLSGCAGVQVIYLYDNAIRKIQGFEGTLRITHLYLQNNRIRSITGLQRMVHLEKLYLDGNRITLVGGLEHCRRLEELHISGQKLKPNEQLAFDDNCMAAIGTSLCVLNASNNRIADIRPLGSLQSLQSLDVSHNLIEDMEGVESILSCCSRLNVLDLRGNPVTKAAKYRDHVIIASRDVLGTLDEKPITAKERDFLRRLQEHKSVAKPKRASSLVSGQKAALGGSPGIVGSGAAMQSHQVPATGSLKMPSFNQRQSASHARASQGGIVGRDRPPRAGDAGTGFGMDLGIRGRDVRQG